jgi:hypothetical protein
MAQMETQQMSHVTTVAKLTTVATVAGTRAITAAESHPLVHATMNVPRDRTVACANNAGKSVTRPMDKIMGKTMDKTMAQTQL